METLEYRMDLSRLEVIALDKSNSISEFNNIIRKERLELPLVLVNLLAYTCNYSHKKGKRLPFNIKILSSI